MAHDVDDFSKIWQAMGRSRTMNDTLFTIYKSGIDEQGSAANGARGAVDIKKLALTRQLYVGNCDRKVRGNISSIYQTLISLANLSQNSFYYSNEIVNVFLDKMEMSIGEKVRRHEESLSRRVMGTAVSCGILVHILEAKFSRCESLSQRAMAVAVVQTILCNVVRSQFEQRVFSGDIHDEYIRWLSGEQDGLMEVSYTKQQQKQKQKQYNKNQDSDKMEVFSERNQLLIMEDMDNYFEYTLAAHTDRIKIAMNLPFSSPILKLGYTLDSRRKYINVYPTLQFLYSHHIDAGYISKEVKDSLQDYTDQSSWCASFLRNAGNTRDADQRLQPEPKKARTCEDACTRLEVEVLINFVKQSSQYTLAALQEGIYLIGMKDQFNAHDLPMHPLAKDVQYISDEMGFILLDRTGGASPNLDEFGPYYIEQYILMEVLSKHEVAANVMDHYVHHKAKLEQGLRSYGEAQGKGFVCWRFIQDAVR
jgi:hypothetical protein